MSDEAKNTSESGPPSSHGSPLGSRRKRRLVVVSVTLVLMVVVLSAVAGYVHRRVRSASAFCLSCHAAATDELGNHAHAKLNCVSCHRSDFWTDVGIWIIPSRANTTQHGQVELATCKTCHFDQRRESKTAKSIGHQNHVTAKMQLTCDKCHALRGHQSPVDPRSCSTCHDKVKVHEHGMTEVACLSCHQFIREGKAGDPGATGCPTCHSGKPPQPGQTITSTATKPITAAVVHGNVNACRLCHEPHRPDPANRRQGSDCGSCHKRVVDQHVEASIPAHRNCEECHAVHGPRPKTPELCVRCHSDELGKASEGKLAARHQGCSGCHKAHTFRPKVGQCSECHKPVQSVVSSWNSDAHRNCLNCHTAHDGKNPASACPTCHQAQRAHGHEKCTVCHEPHTDKSSVKACSACHQPVFERIAGSKVEQHRACGSCHATHAAPRAPARCAACHGKIAEQTQVATAPAHQSCISCHRSHEFSASSRSCQNCHRSAELGPHSEGCTKCHQWHGPPGRQAKSCTTCHENIAPGRGQHSDCASCHGIHKQPRGGPACVACHREKVAAANTWQPVVHQKCDTCHQRHSDKAPKPCAECHGKESSQTLAKGHACLSCHNPHQSSTLSSGLCSSCHQKQAGMSTGATATHASCTKCHQPHDNKLPNCRSCHQSQPGAHAFKGHQRCANCHATHQVDFSGKQKCLDCHKDKLDHYPKAASCTACHSFR